MKIFDSMKKFIILFAIASVLFTGCRLDNGSTSGHDYKRMESYTYRMFNDNVLRPAAEINIFIELIPFRVQLIQNLRFYCRKILKKHNHKERKI